MAKKEKIYMPSGSGGLMRYSDEGKTLIKLKPKHVTYVVGAVVAFELVLKFFF